MFRLRPLHSWCFLFGFLGCVLIAACGPLVEVRLTQEATASAGVAKTAPALAAIAATSQATAPTATSVPSPIGTSPVAEVTPSVVGPRYITERVSVATGGVETEGGAGEPQLSHDGRYVTFTSPFSNFVPNDTNNDSDVFVHDRLTGVTERVSVASDGSQSRLASWGGAISADGRYVAFTSLSNLTESARDLDGSNIYVRDRQTGKTNLISVAPDGTPGNGDSFRPGISADGQWLVFTSVATDLVEGDTNNIADVFVRDIRGQTTRRVSVASDGTQGDFGGSGNVISADGRFVAFTSISINLVVDDTNFAGDVFVHDLVTGQTSRASAQLDGIYSNDSPSISADGRYVAFVRHYGGPGPNLTEDAINVFVVDRTTGLESQVSVNSAGESGNLWSLEPAISGDGRYVAFTSRANNLILNDNNDHDVFVHDRETGETRIVSVNNNGTQGQGYLFGIGISADGHAVAFASDASNIVANDTNESSDVFVNFLSLKPAP